MRGNLINTLNQLSTVHRVAAVIGIALTVQQLRTQWLTADGTRLNPLRPAKGKISVSFFILSDCPIANEYAPEIGRVMARYKSQGILFSIVYVDSKLTANAALAHAKAYGYSCPLVLDPTRSLAKTGGATISPEVVVVGTKGSIVYRGRIDDRAVEIGKIRPKATCQDLRLTLNALLTGKRIPNPKTNAVGCIIGG